MRKRSTIKNTAAKLRISATAFAMLVNIPLHCAADPTVSNVRASQRAQSQLVDILYDLSASDSGPFAVHVVVSTNGGATYGLSAASFSESGIGPAVSPGSRKRIVWNAGADWNGQYSDQVRFLVTASEITTPTGMVLIPAGSFVMGATTNVGHESSRDEIPQHSVYVSSFYMDRYEVTKALWDEVAAWASANGYDITTNSASGKAPNHPAYYVTWYDAVKWSNARAQKDELTPCYTTNGITYKTGNNSNVVCNWAANGYRLPTEAEWEKAARGGTANHRYPWSDSDEIQHARANYRSTNLYIYDTSPTRGYHPNYTNVPSPYTSPVGAFAANDYGLYDMAGNVQEWCWDWRYNFGTSNYYDISPGIDPRGPAASPYVLRVLRGGSWGSSATNTRVANRQGYYPTNEISNFGFRCVRGL